VHGAAGPAARTPQREAQLVARAMPVDPVVDELEVVEVAEER
jgi:hypothetical protein